MLILFSKQIAKLPLANAFPFDANKLAIMPGPTTDFFFVLKEIHDPDDKSFPIDVFMEKFQIFHCKSFTKRMDDFAEIMSARLERFFETRKVDYLFFDKEEQLQLAAALTQSHLTCYVDIYARKDNQIKLIHPEKIGWIGYQKIRTSANELGILYITRLDTFIRLNSRLTDYIRAGQSKFKAYRAKFNWNPHKDKVTAILGEYPDLNVKTKKEFNKAYRKLAQKLHPDISASDDAEEAFARMSAAVDELKASFWYKRLKEG